MNHCVAECREGWRFCEATLHCELNVTSDLECCGPDKRYCDKTEKCEDRKTFVLDCSKYSDYHWDY